MVLGRHHDAAAGFVRRPLASFGMTVGDAVQSQSPSSSTTIETGQLSGFTVMVIQQ